MTYECHITCNRDDHSIVQNVGEPAGWKFSKIDGDPLLGQKVFCYLTRHHRDFEALKSLMQAMTSALKIVGVEVVREKIEHIIYDTKTGAGL